MGGTVSNVSVTLRNLSHTWASDIDVLLVGPAGQKVVMMSDAGSGGANNVTLTLSDAAAAALPPSGLVSGTFRPTNLTDSSPGGDNYPSPAPAGPYGATLSTFNGTAPNGTWALYVFDDGPGDSGSFAGGWSLTITTSGLSPASLGFPGALPRFTAVELNSVGEILLTVAGQPGREYAIQASSDLVNWVTVGVHDNPTGIVIFTNQAAGHALRFYRAISLPKLSTKTQ